MVVKCANLCFKKWVVICNWISSNQDHNSATGPDINRKGLKTEQKN